MRYSQNDFTEEEQQRLANVKVVVIGCGSSGGTAAEMLLRTGVENLVLVDGVNFQESDLNREFACTEATIGQNRAMAMKERLEQINSNANITAIAENLTDENSTVIGQADYVCIFSDIAGGKVLSSAKCVIYNKPYTIGGTFNNSYYVCRYDTPIEKNFHNSFLPQSNTLGSRVVKNIMPFNVFMRTVTQVNETVRQILGKGTDIETTVDF